MSSFYPKHRKRRVICTKPSSRNLWQRIQRTRSYLICLCLSVFVCLAMSACLCLFVLVFVSLSLCLYLLVFVSMSACLCHCAFACVSLFESSRRAICTKPLSRYFWGRKQRTRCCLICLCLSVFLSLLSLCLCLCLLAVIYVSLSYWR